MNNEQSSTRIQLIRDSATLQLKLLADGLRDALLIPISLVATVIGLLRGGDDCDQEFRRVIKLGRRSERWINLFGHQRPLGANTVGQMDKILEQVESVVVDQYKKGHGTAEIRKAVREALKTKEGESKPQ
jgi:hypothetical protein